MASVMVVVAGAVYKEAEPSPWSLRLYPPLSWLVGCRISELEGIG